VETFAYSYYNFRPAQHNQLSEWDYLYNKAHNEFLNFLSTTGAFGLATYLLIILWFSIFALKNRQLVYRLGGV
jgi:O-antigen ligase